MPSIQLDSSSTVNEQDNLTLIGYPGLGDLSTNPTNLLTSSINKIYVSALKTTDSGAPVIQVGGNVEHGDSGGPALDNSGHIVGIVSFGYSGINGDYGQTSFLQASSSALTLIKQLGISTTPGAFLDAGYQRLRLRGLRSLAEGRNRAAEYCPGLSEFPGSELVPELREN
jgi:hypothetical protein